nr:storkhead-box protein 1-like [Taeniopygia guttata]
MPRRAERCLQIAPHSLAIVLDAAAGGRPGGDGAGGAGAGAPAGPAAELGRHRIGYEIFADFKRENMQHFWDRRATAAVAETFFLGWIDEQVLLVQGKEEHLEVLRQGWARRSLKPPSGFHIKCLGRCRRAGPGPAELPRAPAAGTRRGPGAGRKAGPSPPRGFSSQKWVCAKGVSRDGSGGITGMR